MRTVHRGQKYQPLRVGEGERVAICKAMTVNNFFLAIVKLK